MPGRWLDFIRRKHNSIAFKLLVGTSLLIVCPVLIASTVSYSQYTGNLEQKSAEANYQTIVQLSYSLGSYLDQLFQVSGTVYYNNDLMNSLSSSASTGYAGLQKEWTLEEQLGETFISPRDDILSAYIFADGQVYRAGVYNLSVNPGIDYRSLSWYQSALKSDTAIYVPTHTDEFVSDPHHPVFSVVRRINSITKTGKLLGVLEINVDYSTIRSICDQIQPGAGGGLLIEDQNRSVIYSSVQGKDDRALYDLVEKNRRKYFTATVQGRQYILGSIAVPDANWTIISLSSVKELNKSAAQTRNITFLIALLCAVPALVLLFLYIRGFLRPLLRIVALMKDVQGGNLDVSFPEKRKDEIGYLGSSFNKMVGEISGMIQENTRLVREVYETRLLQNEAQINALYSQIKPHFLFNTLNMISLLIRCNKSGEALGSIEKLSDLLRGMTHSNRDITVREELGLLEAYLGIQSTRYGDRLTYGIDIDPGLYGYVIPALTFQPIVENTIVHGCEKQNKNIHIRISSHIGARTVEFVLEDNAGGMGPETLATLRGEISRAQYESRRPDAGSAGPPKGGRGIGLLNVNQRLKMKFGDEYGLLIESADETGTRIRLVLPKYGYSEETGRV